MIKLEIKVEIAVSWYNSTFGIEVKKDDNSLLSVWAETILEKTKHKQNDIIIFFTIRAQFNN